MKTKYLIIFIGIFIISHVSYSQKKSGREILVFFSEGVTQQMKTIKGKTVKQGYIEKETLKNKLHAIGIRDSLLEAALPKFNKSDTVRIINERTIHQADMTKLFKIKIPRGKSRNDLIKYLNNLPEVLYAEPNATPEPSVEPSDSRFDDQWALDNTANPGADIHAKAAWDIYTGNSDNIIAIIDGGTDASHEDLNDKMQGGDSGVGWDGHGTHVAGIAAAESNNSQGISGLDWNARIHPQRVDNVDGAASTYQAVIDAVNYSSNVHVINNSWGLGEEDGSPAGYNNTIKLAFAYAYKANRTSVAAMGNHQHIYPDEIQYPAGYANVIAVGNTTSQDEIYYKSVHGNHIDVSAPGTFILSTINGSYDKISGTSMAAPHVAGIASLLKGYNPDLANDDIERIIELSADDIEELPGFDEASGYGRVNAEAALNLLQLPNELKQWTHSGGTTENSTDEYTQQFLGVSGLADGNYIVKRYEVRKEVTFPESFCDIIGAWGRGVYTTGWSQMNPNFGEGFCEIVPGTLTNTGATLRTYVYKVWDTGGSYKGFHPTSPSNVSFDYTVLGIPNPSGTISGPSPLCSSSDTYTLNEIPQGFSVTWSATPSHLFTSTSGSGSSFSTAWDGSGSGSGTITATLSGECGSVELTKNIWAGRPAQPMLIFPNDQVAEGKRYQACAVAPGASSYDWLVGGGSIMGGQGTDCIQFEVYCNHFLDLIVDGVNACGTGARGEKNVDIDCSGDGSWEILSIHPNPSDERLTVIVEENQDQYSSSSPKRSNHKTERSDTYTYYLYDLYHQLVRQFETNKRRVQITTNNLDAGFYILHVVKGEKVYRAKIEIRH